MDSYLVGLLWASLAVNDEGYWFRHRDRWYCETVRELLGLSCGIQESHSRTGAQYRLKITRAADVTRLAETLAAHGWEPRQAEIRPYPAGALDDRGFIRAWCEVHSHLDIRQAKRRDGSHYPQKRLRVYGNAALLETINQILSSATGLQSRTLQTTANDITKALYYQGRAVQPVIDWLYMDAGLMHPTANLMKRSENL